MTEKKQQPLLISRVHTPCKECVFAKYDGNTQIDCSIGKLQQYRDAGITIHEVEDDFGKEFFLVDGRFCMCFRNEEVMKNHPHETWTDVVKKQNVIPYHLILIVEKEDTLEDVQRVLRQLKFQHVKPKFITLINKQYTAYSENPDKYILPSLLLKAVQDIDFIAISRMRNIYDDTLSDRYLIDIVFDNSKNLPLPFYVVFQIKFGIPKNFTKEFNEAIFDKMLQIGFSRPIDDINGMIVNNTAHKKYAGNSFHENLENKIANLEENGKSFIYNTKEICPSINEHKTHKTN
jgi:hypothetical protein